MVGVIRKIKGKDRYFLDGKEVSKRVFDREMDAAIPEDRRGIAPGGKRLAAVKRGYPYDSMAICVHPDDVGAAMAKAAKMGVPTEYKANGAAVIRDAAHRKAVMKMEGLHDRNSYS